MEYEFLYEGNSFSVSLEKQKDRYKVSVGDKIYEVCASSLSEGLLSLVMDGRSVLVHTAKDERGRIICIGGVPYVLNDPSEEHRGASGSTQAGDGIISTPMPGKIVEVYVKEGESVEKDQPLLVVESMKMQNDILSDVRGVVKKVHFKPGDQAAFGEPLVEIEKD
jgi:biotin carboxyl carrier protein